MYTDGAKLKGQSSWSRNKPHNMQLISITVCKQVEIVLEGLSANFNICIRYGFTSNPNLPKRVIKNALKLSHPIRDKYHDIDSDSLSQYIVISILLLSPGANRTY